MRNIYLLEWIISFVDVEVIKVRANGIYSIDSIVSDEYSSIVLIGILIEISYNRKK